MKAIIACLILLASRALEAATNSSSITISEGPEGKPALCSYTIVAGTTSTKEFRMNGSNGFTTTGEIQSSNSLREMANALIQDFSRSASRFSPKSVDNKKRRTLTLIADFEGMQFVNSISCAETDEFEFVNSTNELRDLCAKLSKKMPLMYRLP